MSWRDRDYSRSGYGMGGSGSFGVGSARSGGSRSFVFWLIAINIVVFVLDGLIARGSDKHVLINIGYFSASTAIFKFQFWRLITYQFLHAGISHIFFNMLALYFFGPMIESYLGSRRFLAFYLLCGVGGVVGYLLLWGTGVLVSTPDIPMVGASACIFGILIAAACVAPNQRVMLIFPPIPMSLKTLAWIFVGISLYTVFANGNMPGHNAGGEAAHLGGAAAGFFLIRRTRLLHFADGLGATFSNIKLHQQQRTAQRSRQREQTTQAEIDRVLDKVREKGLQSLTGAEKRILQRATDRQQGE